MKWTLISRQYGTRESKEVTVEGRVEFDLFQEEDVHHSIISNLQNGKAETRRRLTVYCSKDAYVPRRLLDKIMFIYNYVEMAGSEQGTYEGAIVLEAKAGFCEKPTTTLDFASLYPSIMMTCNLCYCTLVTPRRLSRTP